LGASHHKGLCKFKEGASSGEILIPVLLQFVYFYELINFHYVLYVVACAS
jgi:hypothetical protein